MTGTLWSPVPEGLRAGSLLITHRALQRLLGGLETGTQIK